MQDQPTSLLRRPPVWATLKAAIAITVISLAATQFLSGNRIDREGLTRLASDVTRGQRDPVTTGSINSISSAGKLRLDPCAVEPRR